jgi:enoyl-CoA hydratase/carnithine racemase
MKQSETTPQSLGWKEHRMSAGTALRLDFVQEGIARITYDQPGSRANTLNQGVQTEFEDLLTQLEQQPNLQGLIFCSAKPGMFIAGADLKELASVKKPSPPTPLPEGEGRLAGFQRSSMKRVTTALAMPSPSPSTDD